jgi:hypothetical protein
MVTHTEKAQIFGARKGAHDSPIRRARRRQRNLLSIADSYDKLSANNDDIPRVFHDLFQTEDATARLVEFWNSLEHQPLPRCRHEP